MIYSESSFKYRRHALECVVGISGINLGCGAITIYNPYTDSGNIMIAAKLLRDYKNLYGSYFLAIKRYKGWSALGEQQAHLVMTIYRGIQ